MAGKELQIIIRAIDKASSVFHGVEKKATGLQKTLGVVGKVGGLAVAGLAAAGAAAAGAITAIGVDATKTAISMETAFAGVIKTTDGLTSGFGVLNEAGTELKRAFKDLAETRPVAVEELMRIGELGGQLGIARENLIEFTGVIADIATATDLTAEEAAVGFAQFMNVMGTAQGDVDRLGSTIVDLGNNFATTEPQILAFAQRIGGAGAIAGLTEADVLGIGAAMASVGVEAEAGGTAVQKVLLAMQVAAQGATTSVIDNSSEMAKSETKLAQMSEKLAIARQRLAEVTDKTAASTRMTREKAVRDLEQSIAQEQASLETLAAAHGRTAKSVNEDLAVFAKTAGLTTEKFTALWEEDAGKAFELFVLGLGNQGNDALGTLEQLELQDQRLVRSFLSLAGAGDLVTRSMESADEAWEENTALTEEAGQRYATTESQIALLRNVWRNLKGDIGDALLPAFRSVVEQFQSLAQRYGPELVSFFETKVAPAIETVAGALGQVVVGDWAGALETLFGGERTQQILAAAAAISTFASNLASALMGNEQGRTWATDMLAGLIEGIAAWFESGVLEDQAGELGEKLGAFLVDTLSATITSKDSENKIANALAQLLRAAPAAIWGAAGEMGLGIGGEAGAALREKLGKEPLSEEERERRTEMARNVNTFRDIKDWWTGPFAETPFAQWFAQSVDSLATKIETLVGVRSPQLSADTLGDGRAGTETNTYNISFEPGAVVIKEKDTTDANAVEYSMELGILKALSAAGVR